MSALLLNNVKNTNLRPNFPRTLRRFSCKSTNNRFNDVFIVGAGCIGQSLAISLLKSNLANRVFLQTKLKYLDEFQKSGIVSKGAVEGTFFPSDRFRLISGIEEKFFNENEIKKTTIVFSATKASDTASSLTLFHQIPDLDPVIVCLQNGLGSEQEVKQSLRGKKGTILKGHVLGAVHQKESHLFAYKGKILVEESHESISNALKEIFRNQDKGIFNLEISKDIYRDIYPKIAVNCVCNPLTIILNKNLGSIREEHEGLIRLICHEIFTVAAFQGINLGSSERLAEFVLDMMDKFSEHYSSMYLDHVSGKETEIDYINGGILKVAQENGIDVPINQFLVQAIKEIQIKRATAKSVEEFYQEHDLYLQALINQLKKPLQ